MSDLLTTLTVTAVAPFLWANPGTQPLYTPPQVSVVAKQEAKAPKKEEKVEVKQETVVPETPKVVTYVVQEGDNLSVIAEKFQINWVRIWQKNEQLQNQDQLNVGDTITIPNTDEALADRGLIAPVSAPTTQTGNVSNSTQTGSYRGSGGSNGYTYGWCTWWAKEKRPDIGGYWGDAGYSWISSAQAAGFSTGSVPRAGAIGVTAGHVVYVESVNGNTITLSEMGWGYRANTTPNYRTSSASAFTYIY